MFLQPLPDLLKFAQVLFVYTCLVFFKLFLLLVFRIALQSIDLYCDVCDAPLDPDQRLVVCAIIVVIVTPFPHIFFRYFET